MPFNKANYPSNWREISLRIRGRDGWRCKWCGVPNNTFVLRDDAKGTYKTFTNCERDSDGKGVFWLAWQEDSEGDICSEYDHFRADEARPVKIVLTVAHISHDTSDNSDENLAALCQRCHLRHDAHQHAANAKVTRAEKKHALLTSAGQAELF